MILTYPHRLYGHLEKGRNTKNRMREERTDINYLFVYQKWRKLDTADRGFVSVAFKPATTVSSPAVSFVQFRHF